MTKILSVFLLFIFAFVPLVEAKECATGNAKLTKYLMRDKDKRCEGIAEVVPVSGSLDLFSFTVGQITIDQEEKLRFEIPMVSVPLKKVTVRSSRKRYQLDPLENVHKFQWDSYVLKTEKIPLNTLRGTAFFTKDSARVYLPIIFSKPSNKYDIILYSSQPARKITLIILDKTGREVFKDERKEWQPEGEIHFQWHGRDVLKGQYSLKIEGEVEGANGPDKVDPTTVRFEHDPKWLQ